MKHLIIAVALLTVTCSGACGKSSSKSPMKSCQHTKPDKGTCEEFTQVNDDDDSLDTLRMRGLDCKALDGAWAPEPCPTAQRIGACAHKTESSSHVVYFYAPLQTAATMTASCSSGTLTTNP